MSATTIASTAPSHAAIRVLLVVSEARTRMHMRRLLACIPGVEVAGHARSGAQMADLLQRGGIDMVIVDVLEDGGVATEALAKAGTSAVKMLVLAGENQARFPSNTPRAQVIRRPLALETVFPHSRFSQELQAALCHKASAAARKPSTDVMLKPPGLVSRPPALIAIGSSTGGPQALPLVLGPLGGKIRQPIVITQHMPAAFTQLLAEHLGRSTSMPTVQATDCMPLMPGRIHIAPGGRHLLLVRKGDQVVCSLDDGPPENFCKPAVDPMLRSIIEIYGSKALALILTGMGHDGLAGCRALVAAGGTVLAQDEETSVVWGMPGAVAQAGLCQAVLPLSGIAEKLLALAGGRP
jgi:two-component system, chemotaxis family, protein-glutamate methylesterase/glutaminase